MVKLKQQSCQEEILNRRRFYLIKVDVVILLLFTCFSVSINAQRDININAANSFSFAFFTDIHLDFKGNTLQYFDQAVDIINGLKPDFILTGGDNVKDATQTNEAHADSLYGLYLSHIKRFTMPVHTGIGNHESFGVNNPMVPSENAFYGKRMYESKIGPRYYSFTHKGWKFFMIDGIKKTDTGQRYIGNIDDVQMDWLKKELAVTDSLTPIVICCHIPFISSLKKFESGSLAGIPDNDGISNSVEFFKLFEHHRLKLILQGHFHYLEVLYANDTYYITGPSLTARWGNIYTRKSGLVLFTTRGDELSWKFIENKL